MRFGTADLRLASRPGHADAHGSGGTTMPITDEHLKRLLRVARLLPMYHELDGVFEGVLEAAVDLTGARYGALGILDESGKGLERFPTRGIQSADRRGIGELPRGRGVLGELIGRPEPLRLKDLTAHPRSFGFPPAHPRMRTFLGVPVVVSGRPFANVYLTESRSGEFSESDEEAVVVLAELGAIAIENARERSASRARDVELERARRSLEATRQTTQVLGETTDFAVVLDLLVKRARALVRARAALLLVAEDTQLIVAATAGELGEDVRGERVSQEILLTESSPTDPGRRVVRASIPRALREWLPGNRGLLAPLRFHGRTLGFLLVCDSLGQLGGFGTDDEEILAAVAAGATTALVIAEATKSRDRAPFPQVSAEHRLGGQRHET